MPSQNKQKNSSSEKTVIGSLPKSRPQLRSKRRATTNAQGKATSAQKTVRKPQVAKKTQPRKATKTNPKRKVRATSKTHTPPQTTNSESLPKSTSATEYAQFTQLLTGGLSLATRTGTTAAKLALQASKIIAKRFKP